MFIITHFFIITLLSSAWLPQLTTAWPLLQRLPDKFAKMLAGREPHKVKLREADSGLHRLWDVLVVFNSLRSPLLASHSFTLWGSRPASIFTNLSGSLCSEGQAVVNCANQALDSRVMIKRWVMINIPAYCKISQLRSRRTWNLPSQPSHFSEKQHCKLNNRTGQK